MDKNIRESVIAAVTGIMILAMTLLAGCSDGSVSGKWYPIVEDPATAMGSIELNADGEFRTDGLVGDWEESDGIVQTNLLGFHEVYQVGEYEGYQVLYDDRGRLAYCQSAEDAETIYQMAIGSTGSL